jgi:hypothetical protein
MPTRIAPSSMAITQPAASAETIQPPPPMIVPLTSPTNYTDPNDPTDPPA